MTREHYYQHVDLETGYLQSIRDDTEELQDFRLNAYRQDGSLIKSVRYLYNIQYDYLRKKIWKNGRLLTDEIELESNDNGYEHLQYEFLGSE